MTGVTLMHKMIGWAPVPLYFLACLMSLLGTGDQLKGEVTGVVFLVSFYDCMFYKLLRVQYSCFSTQSCTGVVYDHLLLR